MQHAQSVGTVRNVRYKLFAALPVVLAFVLLFSIGASTLPSNSALAALNLSSISGTVTRAGTPVADAKIVVAQSNLARSATTAADGAYSLTGLPAGEYALSVQPVAITTTSPDWVYTDTTTLVSVPPDATQDFQVEPATVVLHGQLIAPSGATFAEPNQAWVRAENQEGLGNSVQVAEDGTFSINALPGILLLRISLENEQWAAVQDLTELVYYADTGETIDAGQIELQEKQARISGTVNVLGGGTAPAWLPVLAWRLDGSEFEQTVTNGQGQYTLSVIAGTWLVHPMPLEQQPYVSAEWPRRVFLATDTTTATQDLLIAPADVTLNGITVDSVTGEPLTEGVSGRAYALYHEDGRQYPTLGPSTAIDNGAFSLKLSTQVAQVYTIGVSFPADVAYTALSRVTVDLNSTVDDPIKLPITADNAHIRGTMLDRAGDPVTGIPGSVWAASSDGGWARTRVNADDGNYDLAVTTTDINGTGGSTWHVRAFVDPTEGYYVQRPRLQHVFLPFNNGEGYTQDDVDFTLVEIDTMGTISGTVTLSDNRALRGVRVTIHEDTGDRATGVVRWVYTDKDGHYETRVPAGTYNITASYGRSLRQRFNWLQRLINPVPQTLTLAEQGQAAADLQFRISDATVSGQVTYEGNGHTALVQARSADGVNVYTRVQADGQFDLHLLTGQAWTIQAVSSDENIFLRSQELVVTPEEQNSSTGIELVLAESDNIPDSQAFRFQADEDQFFTMSDNSQVQVPAGAFAAEGTVALTVRPLPELVADDNIQPVSFGYRLHAYAMSASGVPLPVSHFARPVTLAIPFTAEQLTALGISIDQLVPAYWDEASESWKPVENVTVIVDEHGGGTVNIAVDHFTDFALMADVMDDPIQQVYLPMIIR